MLHGFRLILDFSVVVVASCVDPGFKFATFGHQTEGVAITSHSLESALVSSKIDCASRCLATFYCMAVSFECSKLSSANEGMCHLKYDDNVTFPYSFQNDTNMCYMRNLKHQPEASSLSVTPVVTTPSTAAIYVSNIIDLANNFQGHCSLTSGYDLGIITTEKIYFYDDYMSLGSPPCQVLSDVTSYFSGFASLPPPSKWDCIMTFQRSVIDVYSEPVAYTDDYEVFARGREGNVYRWVIGIQRLWHNAHYPKTIQDHIKSTFIFTPTDIPSKPVWSVYMNKIGSMNAYFYDASGHYYLYRYETPLESIFTKTDTLINLSSQSLNHWGSIPDNVVGVALIDDEDYLLVTSDLKYYLVDLTYRAINNYDPTIVVRDLGHVRLE